MCLVLATGIHGRMMPSATTERGMAGQGGTSCDEGREQTCVRTGGIHVLQSVSAKEPERKGMERAYELWISECFRKNMSTKASVAALARFIVPRRARDRGHTVMFVCVERREEEKRRTEEALRTGCRVRLPAFLWPCLPKDGTAVAYVCNWQAQLQ